MEGLALSPLKPETVKQIPDIANPKLRIVNLVCISLFLIN